jgi:hypothetical protein
MSQTERAERLAAQLLADRNRDTPSHNIIACFSCGHTFVYRGRQGAASTWIGSDEDGGPSPDTSLKGAVLLEALSGLVRSRQPQL